jgi:hypothetical protein
MIISLFMRATPARRDTRGANRHPPDEADARADTHGTQQHQQPRQKQIVGQRIHANTRPQT